jgi:predicted site-specific integrase-resolvase
MFFSVRVDKPTIFLSMKNISGLTTNDKPVKEVVSDINSENSLSKKELQDERRQFLKLFRKLRDNTLQLRSTLTSLMLHTEEMHSYSDRHKECILTICETINKKNDELIYSEQLMKEVIHHFHPEADI